MMRLQRGRRLETTEREDPLPLSRPRHGHHASTGPSSGDDGEVWDPDTYQWWQEQASTGPSSGDDGEAGRGADGDLVLIDWL